MTRRGTRRSSKRGGEEILRKREEPGETDFIRESKSEEYVT